ncbi:hypothetical protein KDW_13900 [Dictyobacter vulcani]|uniref:Putative restriction endonuclease domain-containing protein n=1 Tax=Dictyobacter vulcani TaxID=2607529 RepID=A0A5J4KDS7_9CHLR|nr:Uma2 family endonuclease [Dictyobacter vulcani]GER87228.1 hypothetical protein KDW_13900 [Dictyobacter vulcani]
MYDPQRKFTTDEYWALVDAHPGRKYEYIDGDIRMMTGGSPAHAQIGARIASLLDSALIDSECVVYNSDVVLHLSDSRVYLPDASVSCDPADWTRRKYIEAPSVVVEILSPTTENTDKLEKLDAYQRYPTIQEILLIDSRRRSIKHYHRVNMRSWEDTLYVNDEDVINLECIEVTLRVKDIYRKVYLELDDIP